MEAIAIDKEGYFMISKKLMTALLATLLISTSGIVDARGKWNWHRMPITDKNCKAAGYGEGRFKISGSWYCVKKKDVTVLKPRMLNPKRTKTRTQATDFHYCGRHQCNTSHSLGDYSCTYVYSEAWKGQSVSVSGGLESLIVSVSAERTLSSTTIEGKSKRVCTNKSVTMQCVARRKQSVRLIHYAHLASYESRMKVTGYKLEYMRYRKRNSSEMFTRHRVVGKKKGTVTGTLKMRLPTNTSAQCSRKG